MSDNYRDIGLLNPSSNAQAPNIPINTDRRGQVYLATHKGEQRLPFMNRSFISFSYGGKWIEDFDLIATQDNRLNRDGYASFDDITSDYDNLDGQYYWSTHYKTNSMDFTLSTDGIDQKMLDNFLHWFRAGVSRELILAEHPNRAIMARVNKPPRINMLPFEQDTEITISGYQYKTKTTLYKGDIDLELVMDQPHWYAVTNILGKKESGNGGVQRYVDLWDDITQNPPREVSIFASQDALKILYEDGIPLGSTIATNMLLGNGAYAQVDGQTNSKLWSELQNPEPPQSSWQTITNPDFYSGIGARIQGTFTEDMAARYSSNIGTENGQIVTDENGNALGYDNVTPPSTWPMSIFRDYTVGTAFTGVIAGAIVDASDNGITSLSNIQTGYFFYSGTAPSPTIIRFSMTPQFENDYIVVPYNSKSGSIKKFNTLTIESITKQELQFTTPNVFTSYNKAIELFKTKPTQIDMTWEKLRSDLRDHVRHADVRAWAIECIDQCVGDNITVNNSSSTLLQKMRVFFPNSMPSSTFTFNSEIGSAQGTFKYQVRNNSGTFNINSDPIIEDVGDMLKSNYIIIQDRNYSTSKGGVTGWTAEHPEYSHRIYHDVPVNLSNIQVLYKNMYL